MCGIAGILDFSIYPKREDLLPMVRIMAHRGPDSEGTMVSGPVALGMRRLSIIDLAGGDQPISNQEGTLTVIQNGEIYNYVELRKGLEEKGYVFKTNSDTEVLVNLYAEHGEAMLPKLNGMFAFAIWDALRNRLFIARDRMGVKPLYYARMGHRFLFASELKSLLTCHQLDRSLDMDAIADYLRIGYIPREGTPFRTVRKLLPGHYMIVDPDVFRMRQWWDLTKVHGEAMREESPELMEELVHLFDQAVRLRMRSDVPVASFLSGGLDSSLISVTAAKMSPLAFQTYNVRFCNAIFDESHYAEMVANSSGTQHHQLEVRPEDTLEKLPLLLWHMDEPIADSAIVPSFLISQFAAQNGKVCLSGLGGDELFGGYSRYIDKPIGPYRSVLSRYPGLARLLLPLVAWSYPRYLSRLEPLCGPSYSWKAYLNHIQLFNKQDLARLSLPSMGTVDGLIESLWNRYPGDDDIGRRQFIDQHTYLPDQILALTDRMSMAVSLEVRVPFMDPNLVHFAAKLPCNLKQNGNGDFKIFLKKALGKRLPDDILTRRKWGFDAPVANWIYYPKLSPLIAGIPGIMRDLVNVRHLRRIIDGREDPRYHNLIWSLLVLSIWLKVHDRNTPPASLVYELIN